MANTAGKPGQPLTAREREVWALLGEGCSNREIAARLSISHGTTKQHVHQVCKKLGVVSRLQAGLAYQRDQAR